MIGRTQAKKIDARVLELLRPLEKELGLKITFKGGILRGSNSAILKYAFTELDSNGEAKGPEADDFTRYATEYGLKPEDLHRTFKYKGKTLKIVGLNLRAKSHPIIAEYLDTRKKIKFPEAYIKGLLSA